MGFGENIGSSEGNLDQQKQDIKSFLREVAEKSSNKILDSMIDNSDYKDLPEKEKKENAINAILKLGGVKYNYLKTGKALPLDLLERMVDEIEEVNQDTQNAINAITSSRLEVKKETLPDKSISSNQTITDNFGNKITYKPNQKSDQGLNNLVDSTVGSSPINGRNFVAESGSVDFPLKGIDIDKNSKLNVNGTNLGNEDLIQSNEGTNFSNNNDSVSENISKSIPESLNKQKTKFLNLIKDSKSEIQLLLEETKKYDGVNGMIEISNSLSEQLNKLSELEIKLNNLIKSNLTKDGKLDGSSVLENEKLFSNIILELTNINNSIVGQGKKLTNILDFKNSTFLGGGKEIINGNSLEGFKQIGKTILRLNDRLIDSQREYERDYHHRLGLYPIGNDTEIYWDGVGVAHHFNKKGLKASAQQGVTHQGTLENLLNHERGSQYLFLVAEELYKEKGVNPILAAGLATVTSSVLMFLREYESGRITPGDVTNSLVIDLGNGNKLQPTITIAGSAHLQVEYKHLEDLIPGANKYIKYFKFDGMINKGGGFKNGGIEKEANHQLYNDQRFITKLILANDTTIDLGYNHNDALSREFTGENRRIYNGENASITLTHPVYEKDFDNGSNVKLSSIAGYGQDEGYSVSKSKDVGGKYGIGGGTIEGNIKLTDNLSIDGKAKGVVYAGENINYGGKLEGGIDYKLSDDYKARLYAEVEKNNLGEGHNFQTGYNGGITIENSKNGAYAGLQLSKDSTSFTQGNDPNGNTGVLPSFQFGIKH